MDSHNLTKEHFFAECKNNRDEHSRSGSDRDHQNIHNSGSGTGSDHEKTDPDL